MCYELIGWIDTDGTPVVLNDVRALSAPWDAGAFQAITDILKNPRRIGSRTFDAPIPRPGADPILAFDAGGERVWLLYGTEVRGQARCLHLLHVTLLPAAGPPTLGDIATAHYRWPTRPPCGP